MLWRKQFVIMIRFLNFHMSRLFFKIKLMIAPFKILNLIKLWWQKLQIITISSYGLTKSKLFDKSKAVSKMTHIKIAYKQHTRFWSPSGLQWKKHQRKIRQDPDARRSMTWKIVTMATTTATIVMMTRRMT